MIVGKLNTKILLEKAVTTRDSYGGEEISYELIVNTWGEIVKTAAIERYISSHKSENISKVVKIRDRTSLSTLQHEEMRLTVKGEAFRVVSWYHEFNEVVFFCENI